MIAFIKSLFGMDAVVTTATKIIDKIAGTDWTSKEKAEFVLEYQKATKHQSPARRFLATMVGIVWTFLIVALSLAYIAGNATGSPEVLMMAKDIKGIMADLIKEPFNYIIGFYFAAGIVNNFKS